MECPYCHKEMRAGMIPAGRAPVFWQPADYDPWSSAAMEHGVRLSPPALLNERAGAWYCADCRTVIVPVEDFEEPLDKFFRKVDDFTDKIRKKRGETIAAREEKRQEKHARERREKDPWEAE